MEDIILYASKLRNLYTTVPTINSFLVQLWVRLSLPSLPSGYGRRGTKDLSHSTG